MICEIISVGTEILLGNIVDSNARYLSEKLSLLGFDVYHHSVVGDNLERLVNQINLSRSRSDIIITTGGLGPTDDDITKEGLSKALSVEMVLHEKSLMRIKNYFDKTGRNMPEINKRQAYMPLNSKAVDNDNGTAPGVICEHEEKIFILLPGPPKEMEPMFVDKIIPYLKQKSNSIIRSQIMKVVGIGESSLQDMLNDLIIKQTNPTIALYAKQGEVQIRITAKSEDKEHADFIINESIEKVKEKLGDNVYGYNEDTLEYIVNDMLQQNNKTIAIAESCTGGLVSSRLIDIPNASKSYINGVICYSNESKMNILGVKQDTLTNYGAVSKETAIEMAIGIKEISKTDIGLSITGIAGPDGGTEEKPVGLCYIGIAMGNKVSAYKYFFNGNRLKVKWLASTRALDIIRKNLI